LNVFEKNAILGHPNIGPDGTTRQPKGNYFKNERYLSDKGVELRRQSIALSGKGYY